MNEAWGHDAGAGLADAALAGAGVSAGVMLRQAREAVGLHVAALAVALKVPVRKLEALEDDRYDQLTDAVFVRALASSVCRTLKIDPQPVLSRLPQTGSPRLVQDRDGLNAPFRAPGDRAPTWLDQLSRPVFLAVFALLLGALVLVLLPTVQRDAPQPSAAAPTAAAAAPGSVIEPALALPLAGPASPSRPVAAAAPSAPGLTASGAAANPPAASGLVLFRAKGPTWVEVTDAKGVVALRRQLLAGEAATASGTVPLQVTVGRVDLTDVEIRGKPFDLAPVSRDNVARFEVK